jgi:ankyrin repeat protein
MYASANGHTEAVELLLRRGAVVDLLNKNCNTALHSACHFEHEGAVRLLQTAGASTTLEDNQGHYAMDCATAPRNAAVRHILQQHMHAEEQ